MSLKEKLMVDLKNAMKEKNTVRKNTITMIRAAIKQKEVDERKELKDSDIIDIISKQLKERKSSIIEFEKGNRQDLVDLTNKEIKILLEYLPQQLSESEIDELVKEAINETEATSIKDMGKIMKILMPKVKGKADGNLVNQSVRKFLN
ncbi:MAG: GatB/YqeY domain-containing protein [Tissierellia bacterium]|nr:GatB/YqeY domain-containing protein [Tissierellia bacterium]